MGTEAYSGRTTTSQLSTREPSLNRDKAGARCQLVTRSPCFVGSTPSSSISVFSPFIWDGDWYNSAAAAFHASKLESRTARIPFIKYSCKPWRANQIGSEIRAWQAFRSCLLQSCLVRGRKQASSLLDQRNIVSPVPALSERNTPGERSDVPRRERQTYPRLKGGIQPPSSPTNH